MTQHPPPRTTRFDALFSIYAEKIFAYCRTRSRSSADAEDALAEVFLVAWRRLDDVPEGHSARAWLYATARRVTANQLRAARRSAGLIERLSTWHEEPVFDDLGTTDPTHELVHEVLRITEWSGSYSAPAADFIVAPFARDYGSEGYQFPDDVYDFVFTAKYQNIGSTPAVEVPKVIR